jgi:hypothetical protein
METVFVLAMLVFLFKAGATVLNETTAALTAVYDNVEPYQAKNDKRVLQTAPSFLFYYGHSNSVPKDWANSDAYPGWTAYRNQSNAKER